MATEIIISSGGQAVTEILIGTPGDAEATIRANADTVLQTNIDAEAATRLANDTTLQTNIDAEATSRAAADTTLQTNIDAEATARTNADALLIPIAEKGALNGVATLDGAGLIPDNQLPALAITNTSVVASEAAMLALNAQTGDVAIRTDTNQTFILNGTSTVLADWNEVLNPIDGVTSVTAGTGLLGGAITSTGTIDVDFAGGGVATTVARSDRPYIEVNGLQTALDGKLAVGAKAADADLLDGLDSTAFVQIAGAQTITGLKTFEVQSNDSILKVHSTETDSDVVDWNFIYQRALWTQGGASGTENYYDHVYTWGMNLGAASGVKADPLKPYMAHHWESKFSQGGGNPYGSEYHLTFIPPSTTANYRLESYFVPHDHTIRGSAAISRRLDVISWQSWGDATEIIHWNLDENGPTADFNAGMNFRFQTNNVPVIKQRNAAGNAVLALPYYDDADRMQLAGPVNIVGVTPTTGSLQNVFCRIQPVGATPNNGTLASLAYGSVTGTYNVLVAEGAATNDQVVANYNNNNAPTSNAVFELRTIGSTAGDPKIKFNVNGAVQWQVGLDNSEGDKFKISTSDLGGVGDALTIDPLTGNFGIGTTTPLSGVHIDKPFGSQLRIQETSGTYFDLVSGGRFDIRNAAGTVIVSIAQSGNPVGAVFNITTNGNAGLGGLAMPTEKLHVAGNALAYNVTRWLTKTANYTAVAGDGIFADTTTAAFTITLPAGVLGQVIEVKDNGNNFATNNLTVGSFVLSTNGEYAKFVHDGTAWVRL